MSLSKKRTSEDEEDLVEFSLKFSRTRLNLTILALVLALVSYSFFVPSADGRPSTSQELSTFVFFLFACWGIGKAVTRGLASEPDAVGSFFVSLGVGLGVFPILAVALNSVSIPLHWTAFLAVAALSPLARTAEKLDSLDFKSLGVRKWPAKAIKKFTSENTSYGLFAVLIACIMFTVYIGGAFGYPHLEDDDPWEHAAGAKYVSIYSTYSIPADLYVAHYLEPYPPAYDTLMGVLHQLNSSVSWTLKYFNSLIVSLGVVFFYFFMKKLSGDSRLSAAATLVLALIPSYVSHFIWAQALGVSLFFPAFYALESIRDDRRWVFPATLIIAGVMVVQPSTAFTFGLFYAAYILCRLFYREKILRLLVIAGVAGLVLAVALYWIPSFMKFGYPAVAAKIQFGGESLSDIKLKPGTSEEDRLYGFNEFLHAPKLTHMAQPKGLGEVLCLLIALTIMLALVKPKLLRDRAVALSVLWFFLAVAGLESAALPVNVMPSRFWTFLAIPSAMLCATGLTLLHDYAGKTRWPAAMILAVVFCGLFITSGVPKVIVQTSTWPPGVDWNTDMQYAGYITLKNLPPDTTVYPACFRDDHVIGLDKLSFPWDREVMNFRENTKSGEFSAGELNGMLKNKGYRYVILDSACLTGCRETRDASECEENWNQRKQDMDASRYFSLHYRDADVNIYRVR